MTCLDLPLTSVLGAELAACNRSIVDERGLPRHDGGLHQCRRLHKHVQVRLQSRVRRWRPGRQLQPLPSRHRLLRLWPRSSPPTAFRSPAPPTPAVAPTVLARTGSIPAAAPTPDAGLPGDNRHRANSAFALQHPIDRPSPCPLFVHGPMPESSLRTWLWRSRTARRPRPHICSDLACLLRSHPDYFSKLRRSWILSRSFLYRMPWMVVRADRNQRFLWGDHFPDLARLQWYDAWRHGGLHPHCLPLSLPLWRL